MRERHVLIAAVVLFLVLAASPVWYARAAGSSARGPELKRPDTETACVMPTAVHALVTHGPARDLARPGGPAGHAELDLAGRQDLQDQPHGHVSALPYQRAEFCDRCHSYAGVAPPCWECHVDAARAAGSLP